MLGSFIPCFQMSRAILRGYHFTPTEEELIYILMAFLKYKAQGEQFPSSVVVEKVLYGDKSTPWEIFGKDDPWESVEGNAAGNRVKEVVYVFTQLSAIGPKNKARSAGCGTWDGERVKEVKNRNGLILGTRRRLRFRLKEDSESQEKGQWRMNEYELSGVSLKMMALKKIDIGDYVICKVTRDCPKCENPTNNQVLGKRKSDGAETSYTNKQPRILVELYEACRFFCQGAQTNDRQLVSSSKNWADTRIGETSNDEDDDMIEYLQWFNSAGDCGLDIVDVLAPHEMIDSIPWETLADISSL